MYAITDAKGITKPGQSLSSVISTQRRCFEICLIRAAIADPLHHAGMIKVKDNTGANIYLEVFKLPTEKVGSFLQQIPSPLGLGTVDLEDGKSVKGFICEGYVASGDSGFEVEEITHLQGWLDYVKQRTC